MPTIAVAIVVALVIVLAVSAVAWFRGGAWPLGLLAIIMIASFLTYLFNHAPAVLVLGIATAILLVLGGILYGAYRIERVLEYIEREKERY